MKTTERRLAATLGAVALAFMCAAPAPPMPQESPQCQTGCKASYTCNGPGGQCWNNSPGFGCGTIGLSLSIQKTDGACQWQSGACTQTTACSFNVSLSYATQPGCATTLSGVECGTAIPTPTNLPPCFPGPCNVRNQQFTVNCNATCNISYTLTEQGVPSNTVTLTAALDCTACQ